MKKTIVLIVAVAAAASALGVMRGWSVSSGTFPHDTHLEAGLECAQCHEVEVARDMSGSLLPEPSVCTDCHESSDLQAWGYAERPDGESRFETFSHAAHLEAGMDCETCHPGIYRPMAEAADALAGHATCFDCHDGIQQPDACESCHTALVDGRLSDLLTDPSVTMPMDHHPDFIRSHEFRARLQGTECRECHRQDDFCAECHLSENVTDLVHGRNWLFTHPVSARKDLWDCQACHDREVFCNECHAGSGVRPLSHAQPGFLGGANYHGDLGRRDIESCAACHEHDAGMTCTGSACHTDTGLRGDQPRRNIHPSGFAADAGEGYWHDDPAASCFDCHTNTRAAGVGFCGYCHGTKD